MMGLQESSERREGSVQVTIWEQGSVKHISRWYRHSVNLPGLFNLSSIRTPETLRRRSPAEVPRLAGGAAPPGQRARRGPLPRRGEEARPRGRVLHGRGVTDDRFRTDA